MTWVSEMAKRLALLEAVVSAARETLERLDIQGGKLFDALKALDAAQSAEEQA